MLIYSIVMFAVSALFMVFSVLIFKGKTHLIHDYHQERVKDHQAYGRAFGKALSVVAAAPLVSGMIALLGESTAVLAVCLLMALLLVGFGCLLTVQKKHNGGVF